MGETDDPAGAHTIIDGNAEDLYVVRSGTRITIGKKEPLIPPKQASLEDFARARETSRNVELLDERDLNAAEEMLLASLEAIRQERAIRAGQQDGDAKLA